MKIEDRLQKTLISFKNPDPPGLNNFNDFPAVAQLFLSLNSNMGKPARVVTTTLAHNRDTMVHSAMRPYKASNLELKIQKHYNYPKYIVFWSI